MTCSYKKLISKNNIENEIRLIEGSETDYIDNLGNIYKEVLPDQFYLKKNHINNHNGYTYCGISYPDGNKQRRVHVLVAKAFIPNPNNYKIVGHLHNNKSCTDYRELYWTTTSENTKRAFDDGMAKNDKGFDDSQSMAIDVYSLPDMNFIETLGSVIITHNKYNVSKSTVLRHCRNEVKSYRGKFTFRFNNSLTTSKSNN